MSCLSKPVSSSQRQQRQTSNFVLPNWGPTATYAVNAGTKLRAQVLGEHRFRGKREQSSVSPTPGTADVHESPAAWQELFKAQ